MTVCRNFLVTSAVALGVLPDYSVVLAGSSEGFLSPTQTSTQASETAAVIRALDSDGSGIVERAEIESFAERQGLDAADVQAEFRDLDLNGDGNLAPDEIGKTLAVAFADAASNFQSPMKVDVATASGLTKVGTPTSRIAAVTTPASFLAPHQEFSALAALTAQPVGSYLSAEQGRSMSPMTVDDALQTSATMQMAESQADRFIASAFAGNAGAALQMQKEFQEKAALLEEQSRELHGRAAEVLRNVRAETAAAAKDAANAVLRDATAKVQQLEQQANDLATQASERRKAAADALAHVAQAGALLSSSVQSMQQRA